MKGDLVPVRRASIITDHAVLDVDQATAHPGLAAVLRWWRSFERLPCRRDVSPFAIPVDVLPRVLLLDVEHRPFRVKVRLAGTQVCDEWGLEPAGRYLDDLYEPDDLPIVMAGIRACVTSRQPNFIERRFIAINHRRVTYRRLLMPLSDDGERITGLLSASYRV